MPDRIVYYYIKHLKEQPFYIVLNTLAAISFAVLFSWLYVQNSQLHHQAKDAKILAAKNSQLVNKIQNNRRDLIYKSCRDQNKRHGDSLKALRKLLAKSGVSKARQNQSFRETKTLIDALVPKRNCVALASNTVKPKNTKGEK